MVAVTGPRASTDAGAAAATGAVGRSGVNSGAGRDAGLSLVELMVTLVIAAIVSYSIFVFFISQQRVYEWQTRILNTQQSLWAGTETMARYVRAAGSGSVGCVNQDTDGAGADVGDGPIVGGLNLVASPYGAFTLPLPAAPVTSGAGVGGPGMRAYIRGIGVVRIPPLWIVNNWAGAATQFEPGTDIITIAFGSGSYGSWSDRDLSGQINAGAPRSTPETDRIRVNIVPALGNGLNPITLFNDLDFVLAFDARTTAASASGDRGCTLFQITTRTSPDLLEHASNAQFPPLPTGSPWNPESDADGADMIPFDYTAGLNNSNFGVRVFGQLMWVQFSIKRESNIPGLYMQRLDLLGGTSSGPQLLAEGIEDLQIAYACDTNPNNGDLVEGTPTRATDEWFLNDPADGASVTPLVLPNCNRPQGIRMTLISRSLTADDTLFGTPSFRPAAEDRVAGPPDHFRRRILRTSLYPRN